MQGARGNRPPPYRQPPPRGNNRQPYRQPPPRGNNRQPYRQNNNYEDIQEYEKPNAFLSFLLYFLAIIALCFFIGLLVFRSTGVGHVIRSTNIYFLLEQATDEEHVYYIVNQVNGLHFHDQQIDLVDVSEFLQRESVSDEIGVIVDGYAVAFIMGNHDHHVTTEDIVQMARNLEPDFYELFDYKMTEADIEHLAQTLDDVLDFDTLSVGGIMEDFDVDLTVPLVLISPVLLWAVGLFCALLLFLIFFIRRKDLTEAFLAVGITLAAAGLLTFIGGLIASMLSESMTSPIFVFSLSLYLGPVSHLIMQNGFVFSAIGVLFIVVTLLYRTAQRKRG